MQMRMVTIARFGMLAIVGVASAAVALPHLLATGHAAPAAAAAVPVVPVGVEDVPTRQLHVPPPQRKKLQPAGALEIDHLPKLAPYSLPPRLMLRARAHAPAGRRALERRVLHSSHLALSPAAKPRRAPPSRRRRVRWRCCCTRRTWARRCSCSRHAAARWRSRPRACG